MQMDFPKSTTVQLLERQRIILHSAQWEGLRRGQRHTGGVVIVVQHPMIFRQRYDV